MSDRPDYCCGACPAVEPTTAHPNCEACRTGYDCTCRNNPNCTNYQGDPPMTDITDKDRHAARAWAKNWQGDQDADTSAAARVILATVDAPTPTIADEIMDLGRALDQYGHFDALGIDVAALADRVAQMEHDLTEARAEVERLTAERETNTETHTHTHTETHSDNAVTDPADVKPGEAWLVRDEQELSIAVRDAERWVLTHLKDATIRYRRIQHITLLHRLVPSPRVITNPNELDQAKRCTIIRDGVGVICERAALGDGWFTTRIGTDQTPYIELPATVIWEPGA